MNFKYIINIIILICIIQLVIQLNSFILFNNMENIYQFDYIYNEHEFEGMDNNISTSTSTQTSTQTPTSTSTTSSSYQPYDQTNALILAQQNAGNILFLKQQIDDLYGLKNQIKDLSNNYIKKLTFYT